jgi:ABC-2 type transport system ATP-binding protein
VTAITADGLTKSYRGVTVLSDLDIVVEDGSIAASIGPNGAGKTTLVEILEGHRGRDSGGLSVLGCDPGHVLDFRRLRAVIGVVTQQTVLEPALTPRDLLLRQASYYANPVPLKESMSRFDLDEFARKPVRSLSGGMRRRLDLALAFVGRPGSCCSTSRRRASTRSRATPSASSSLRRTMRG